MGGIMDYNNFLMVLLVKEYESGVILVTNVKQEYENDKIEMKREFAKQLEHSNVDLIRTKIELEKHQQDAKGTTIRIHNVSVPNLSHGHYEDINKTVVQIFEDANIHFES